MKYKMYVVAEAETIDPGILRIRGMVGQECVAKIGDWGDGQTCGL